nr:hypothetical protein Iba_chr07eCG2680 [Ipomoea batatas]
MRESTDHHVIVKHGPKCIDLQNFPSMDGFARPYCYWFLELAECKPIVILVNCNKNRHIFHKRQFLPQTNNHSNRCVCVANTTFNKIK